MLDPLLEAFVARRLGAELSRKFRPRGAGVRQPEEAIEDLAIAATRPSALSARRFVR
jgi:hypothetical protein